VPEADLLAGARAEPPDLAADPFAREVARALAVIERPAGLEEIAAAVRAPAARVRAALARLVALDAASRHVERRTSLHSLVHPRAGPRLLAGAPAGLARRMHARLAGFLRARPRTDVASRKHLVRHLLAAGRLREGRVEALRVAGAFQDLGRPLEAVRVLSEAALRERRPGWRLRFAESMSALLEEAGDHQEAKAVLEPVHRDPAMRLDARSRVRVCRRLGIHFHRTGDAKRAGEFFAEVRLAGDPERDVEEFIIVESELAELHTLRGGYEEAETACRRGLELLSGARRAGESFRGSMEVMLRASLGHLELRRMHLAGARRELEAAAALARRFGTTTTRARILNNLGIVRNNLNRLAAARRCYAGARRLHERAGDQRGVILTLLNVATIAAKVGDAPAAQSALQRSLGRLASFPERRLRFYSRREREVIDLVHFQGLRVAEAAGRMGKTALATAVLLCNARKRLRGLLKGEDRD
jgi:tetratricopeptide (TPR) repeat protein